MGASDTLPIILAPPFAVGCHIDGGSYAICAGDRSGEISKHKVVSRKMIKVRFIVGPVVSDMFLC
jgi:hypothetical protein